MQNFINSKSKQITKMEVNMYIFTIIVPVFQSNRIFQIFYQSLIKTIEYKSKIIFINDNSPSETTCFLNTIDQTYTDLFMIKIISHSENMGCAKSINEAFPFIDSTYTVLIDSDTILTSHWQEKALNTLTKKTFDCLGGVLVYPQTGGIQNCGITFSEATVRHLFLNSSPQRLEKYKLYPVQATVFAFFIIPTSVINETGFLSEKYFNGYEDLDYQMRIRQLGYTIGVNSDIELYHWEKSNGIHRSNNRKSNLSLFWKKYGGIIKQDLWDFIKIELNKSINNLEAFYGIDLCTSRLDANAFWEKAKGDWNIQINEINDLSYWLTDCSDIYLSEIMNIDSFRIDKTILFLVDNFVQLSDNHYWYLLRKNYCENDLIVDLYGNVMRFKDLETHFWPGKKIR